MSLPTTNGTTHQDVAGSTSTVAYVVDMLATHAYFTSYMVARPHPLLVLVREENQRSVLLVPSEVWDTGRWLLSPFAASVASGETSLLMLGTPKRTDVVQGLNRGIAALVSARPESEELAIALRTSFNLMESKARADSRGKWLDRYKYELGELIEIARAITTERQIDKLLGLILEKARFITGADAGSIYVVEGDDPDPCRRALRFKLSQNESIHFDSREFTVPISASSIAGSAALSHQMINIADVYNIPPTSGYSFDPRFDSKIGYRTQSMLTAPLIDHEGEVIGILQLINKKTEPKIQLLSMEDVEQYVVPFDNRSEGLLATLAAQAGISLENAMLYDDIRSLFEGFVKASVEAIEQRDPTTSGHSRRVADLTVSLAKALETQSIGPYRDVVWKPEDLREIEYASLLHDFGKIGVREKVLIKAKKLYPYELSTIRQRFDFVVRSLEVEMLSEKIRLLQAQAPNAELKQCEQHFRTKIEQLEEAWEMIESSNEPTVLKSGEFARIEALALTTYRRLDGQVQSLLSPEEISSLSVARGSLKMTEIDEIRSHVVHTFNFLRTIPWGRSFRNVPTIAGAHHERLNGTGYPNRLRAEQIPLQSKMMSVSDIFDALTASDRPYKKAVPIERALQILDFEVKDEHLDGDLVRIFREAKVWEVAIKSS
jgi:HD-GYP domain-containing protein (c-di-GMP phosphodiesterase class II)